MSKEEHQDVLATCNRCGSAYAAIITEDGKILPLGARNGCRCGGTSFTEVSSSDVE